MSGNTKKNTSGSSGAKKRKKPAEPELTIDSLLGDIELEEKKTIASMPGIDFGDFSDETGDSFADFDEADDFSDFDEFADLDEFLAEHEAAEGNVSSDDGFDDDFDDDFDDAEEPALDKKSEDEKPDPEDFFKEEKKSAAKMSDDPADLWADDDDDPESKEGMFAGLMDSLKGKSSGESQNSANKWMPIVIIALLIIIIILLMRTCGGAGNAPNSDDWFDQAAIEGTLPGKTPEEIQAMLNQIVEEGMFNISIAPVIAFENGEAQGQARIENVPANHYNMSVSITLDETAETIYESKGIKPGQYIEYITLQKDLAPGEYAATALFKAYDAETLAQEGQVAVKITIFVEG